MFSTLANFDAVVQGYQRDSKAMGASMWDNLKMSNSNTAKGFSAVKTLATRYAAVASRIDVWDHWYSTPAKSDTLIPLPPSAHPPLPDLKLAAATAPMGAPSGPSGNWSCPSLLSPPIPPLHLPYACFSGFGLAEGGGGTTRTPPSP